MGWSAKRYYFENSWKSYDSYCITNEKQMADVISGEFILNIVDPQFIVWRQGDVQVHVTSLSDQRDDVSQIR